MEITLLTLAFNISNDNCVFVDVIEVPSLLITQEIASVSLMEIGWMQCELSGGCSCGYCVVNYSYSQSDTDFLSGGSTEMTGKISNHSHSHTTVHPIPNVRMSRYGND
jgi:hypothetical protein